MDKDKLQTSSLEPSFGELYLRFHERVIFSSCLPAGLGQSWEATRYLLLYGLLPPPAKHGNVPYRKHFSAVGLGSLAASKTTLALKSARCFFREHPENDS
jgi:hypothetical protein